MHARVFIPERTTGTKRPVRFALFCALCSVAALHAFAQTNVLTWHNDNFRSGQNLSETILTPQNVMPSSFGKLFSVPVDGKVDAQPLYVSALPIAGYGPRNVVFAVSEHDSVYAFDADSGTLYWHVSLLESGETTSDNRGCGQVTPEIGITATPVIDLTAGPHGTIYVVAMSKNSSNYFQRLHALDLTTGAEEFGGPVAIQASFPGSGDNSSNGNVIFDPKQYKSRPGLLLLNGIVYTSWGSHCDIGPYTGWLIGYANTTLQQTSVFNFAPNGEGAALWNSGSGPAVDAQGNIFVAVANGTFDTSLNAQGFPTSGDYGNAFVKLTLQNGKLEPADYWTMDNSTSESDSDTDLGSGGIMLLSDMQDANGHTRHLAVGGGKDGNLWVVDRDNMGKYDSQTNATIYQQLSGALSGGMWGSPAYFNGRVYFGAVSDPIQAFQFTSAQLVTSPVSSTSKSFGFPGATPSISANGSSNAILWAVENSSTAVLHAYDANDLGTELYNSNQAPSGRDQFGSGNKFIVPAIANGKVFVGTTNSVAVFGLFPAPPDFTIVPGALQRVSAGVDGSLWGINSSGQIFSYNAQSSTWTYIPGTLTSIAVGASNIVWGLNAGGQIYRWNATTQRWDNIPGSLSQLRVGADGDVWGLNSTQLIFHFDAQTQSWTWIPGNLAQISVGFDGAVWGVNAANEIFRFNPGKQRFDQIPGTLTGVWAGADGDVWGVNAANQSYHFNHVTASWDNVPGTIEQIAVGSGQNVWALDPAGQVYRYDSQTASWTGYGGFLAQISASAEGSIWGVDGSNRIYEFTISAQPTQVFQQVPGVLTQIGAAFDGTVWGVNSSGQIWTFDQLTGSWTYIPGTLAQIAVATSGDVWGINSSGQIYRYDTNTGSWQYIPGWLVSIATGANGDVWGLNGTGQIYRFNNSSQSWSWIAGTLTQIAVGADGAVWGLNAKDEIYQFNPLTQSWTHIPGSLSQIAVGSSTNVWGINSAGSIYRFDAQAGYWVNVPGTLAQVSVGFDGDVWGVDSSHQVRRWNSQAQTWTTIPGLLSQIVVAADGVVWGLDPQNNIFVYR